MKKNEKAITLVALVITIIVLLILAGVTLRIVFNGGIIDKSQNAVDQYSYQSKNEEEQLAEFENFLEKYFNKEKTPEEEFPIDKTPGDIGDREDSKEKRKGTESDPYLIESIEDLVAFSYNVNNGNAYEGKTVALGRSLFFDGSNDSYVDENAKYIEDTNGYKPDDSGKSIKELLTENTGKGFIPIGINSTSTFKGTFDGKNHYLSGIYINSTGTYTGLFGFIQVETTIKNLGIKDGNVTGASNTGGIVGQMALGKIENCYNNNSKIKGNMCVGGIVGIGPNVINCYNTGDITGTGNGTIGGIIGNSTTYIINCYNEGKVTGENANAPAGGIAGYAVYIYNSYNIGEIENTQHIAGGIGGNCNNIINCYNRGKITSSGKQPIGGIIGTGSDVINCYNEGNVEGIYHIGGIMGSQNVGFGANTSTLENCYNIGKITNKGVYNASDTNNNRPSTGGIVGIILAGGSPTNCHNSGEITGVNEEYTGEIYGQAMIEITTSGCTYFKRSTNAKPNNAKDKNESEMNEITSIETFVDTLNTKVQENNDLEDTKWKEWTLDSNEYPVFK